MKKKAIWILLAAALLAIFFVPIPSGVYRDGGSRGYTALTYKIVDWNRLVDGDLYDETRIYWFPDNFKSIDDLWAEETLRVVHSFVGTVLDLTDTRAMIEPAEGEWERQCADQIYLYIADLGDIGAQVGSDVEIYYTGGIMETYPAQISVVKWELARDLRHKPYNGQWMDKSAAEKVRDDFFRDIVITEIYSDCFFARTVIPLPEEIRINGTLTADWCVGDQVICTCENVYYDSGKDRIEANLISIAPSDFEMEPGMAYKPVIYLYPEEETPVSVKLELDGRLSCTYPAYDGSWQVTAAPDGTLTDAGGQIYNYLYWEGETAARWDMSEGFCVRGRDTAAFLETALAQLGLTRREANEFIVYWLPLMEQNPYNIISFQTEAYTDAARLQIDPAPDALIRVFMVWQASDCYVEIQKQTLTAPERTGFTVVEWGGTEAK